MQACFDLGIHWGIPLWNRETRGELEQSEANTNKMAPSDTFRREQSEVCVSLKVG